MNGSPQEEFSEDFKTRHVNSLKNEFILFSAGSTLALLAAAKAFKPPNQKNLLTVGQAFLGIVLINMVGMRATERAYRKQQKELEAKGMRIAAEEKENFEEFTRINSL